MIRIPPAAEPPSFQDRVREQGRRFLTSTPRPTTKQWASHAYWREFGGQLHDSYDGICAYSCHWIPYDTGADSVEHFRPKGAYPDLAYEWSNYRLVCLTLNGRKGTAEDVIDPFLVTAGWFTIDFPSMLVRAAANLDGADAARVDSTIKRLGLNDEGTCLKSRVKYLSDYCSGGISLDHFRRHAPFIVYELERQGNLANIREIFLL